MKRKTKLYRSGHGLVVTLPADWIRGHGLVAGATLDMEYDDGNVRVMPEKPEGILLRILKTTKVG